MADQKIIVAYDGSPDSDKALNLAANLAKALGASIDLVSVFYVTPLITEGVADTDSLIAAMGDQLKKTSSSGMALAEALGVTANAVTLEGNVADEIIRYADETKAFMIVAGTRGMGGFERMLVGSVAQALVAHATVPVLVVK